MNRKVKHNLAWELVTMLKTDFFPQMKTSRKVHNCLHWFFYPPDNVLLVVSNEVVSNERGFEWTWSQLSAHRFARTSISC